jgi:hypothetical protein
MCPQRKFQGGGDRPALRSKGFHLQGDEDGGWPGLEHMGDGLDPFSAGLEPKRANKDGAWLAGAGGRGAGESGLDP